MNLKKLLPLILFFFALNIFAAFSTSPNTHYSTSCRIRDGKAFGYVHNSGDAFEINGYVWFTFYDENRLQVYQDDEYEYEYISARSSELVEYTKVDYYSKAKWCTLDIRPAIVPKE